MGERPRLALLTGERGHYELAAGHDLRPYLRTMENFASVTGLLPEQVWDEVDRPEIHMHLGKPTGAAMPLMWAHAEYIKLLRSVSDGRVFDLIPEVRDRYLGHRKECQPLEIWKPNRQVRVVKRGHTLRVQMPAPFRLHWSSNEWQEVQHTASQVTALGIEFVDVPIPHTQQAPIRFTFLWTTSGHWEERDYALALA